MYLREFNGEQQRAFLVLVRQVIAADERLAMQEVECLETIYAEMGVEPEMAGAPDVALDLNLLFSTPRSQSLAFMELYLVAFADGVLQSSENSALTTIADSMGVTEETRAEVRSWVRRYLELYREGEQIGLG